jgi:hypothetical protein
MPRIYTEIRISHPDLQAKHDFEEVLERQAKKYGMTKAGYIHHMVVFDSYTGMLNKVKEGTK